MWTHLMTRIQLVHGTEDWPAWHAVHTHTHTQSLSLTNEAWMCVCIYIYICTTLSFQFTCALSNIFPAIYNDYTSLLVHQRSSSDRSSVWREKSTGPELDFYVIIRFEEIPNPTLDTSKWSVFCVSSRVLPDFRGNFASPFGLVGRDKWRAHNRRS